MKDGGVGAAIPKKAHVMMNAPFHLHSSRLFN